MWVKYALFIRCCNNGKPSLLPGFRFVINMTNGAVGMQPGARSQVRALEYYLIIAVKNGR